MNARHLAALGLLVTLVAGCDPSTPTPSTPAPQVATPPPGGANAGPGKKTAVPAPSTTAQKPLPDPA